MKLDQSTVFLVLLASISIRCPGVLWGNTPLRGRELQEPKVEPAKAREERHARVAARRAGPIIIVHRGASAFAPENTLEAYAAAMDYGADGVEVDIRRTADGVLVLFHDDMLDRVTSGFGAVNQFAYGELVTLSPQIIHGRPGSGRMPTFAALLELARQRAMLLHLDVKEPGLDDDIAGLLDAADAWDHVVAVNRDNATKLVTRPELRLLPYKTALYEDRRDVDPDAVRAGLAKPGQMLIVDDPRVAVRELKRAGYRPVPLPKRPYADARSPGSSNSVPGDPLRDLPRQPFWISDQEAIAVLSAEFPERTHVDGDADYQRRRAEIIVKRALAAARLGLDSGELPVYLKESAIQVLERTVKERSLHRDWRYHGLDGAIAARTLAKLEATQSAPTLIEALLRVDPELKTLSTPMWEKYPVSWIDWRLKLYALQALGDLRCAASKKFLLEYFAMDESQVREFSTPQFDEATKSLLCHELSREELVRLLRNPNTGVRGTAILEFLDHPTRDRTVALKIAVPWALNLPRAREK